MPCWSRTIPRSTPSAARPIRHRAPRIVELGWNLDRGDLPLVALVGKGVVFDTGGLDIKPAAGMRNMKKDMGGAAHALALARLVMAANLPVRLVVLVAGGGERHRRRRLPAGRGAGHPQGPDHRDRQHRCRGPADPADILTRAGESRLP
jgi:leucyl aminopeptidase